MSGGDDSLAPGQRICPYYAVSQLKILGVSQTNLMGSLILFGLMSVLINPVLDAMITIILAYTLEKFTAKYPDGFLHYAISTRLNGPIMRRLPAARSGFAKVWQKKGLPLPSEIANHYEP